MRRAAFIAAIVIFVLLTVMAGIVWLLTAVFGAGWISAVLGILIVLIVLSGVGRVIRSFRLAATPMSELIEASARVEAGEVGAQVPERGPREVRTLARAFNSMSRRLGETDAERRRLLADVSHELRTPLTVIQGNVEGILDGLYPAERAILERILAETHHLERLIEDLRLLSMADAGVLALQREATDLGALATDVVAAFAPQATGAGVTLVAEPSADLPDLELDPLRIRQAITNLVSNALRHTPAGGRVTVSVARDGGGQRLSVADTGAGMAEEAVARAFERFWRSPDSPGTGLGLAIVRDIVLAHGGSVGISSEPGRGTTLDVHLPGRDEGVDGT